jgi:NADH dehydrogenase
MGHRVVVVGGGFGGLYAAKALARADVEVTVLDRTNHHLFQPLLYQVATGILSEGEIAPALRSILRRSGNVHVRLAEVDGFDVEGHSLSAVGPDERRLSFTYDSLIVAAGAGSSWFGHDDWRALAPGMKTLDDARLLRSRILGAFEMAELVPEAERGHWLTFVVVGGGPTGVELTGEIATLARKVLPDDFRDAGTLRSRIVLVDAAPSILQTFPQKLSRRAASDLVRWGVEIRTGTTAVGLDEDGIELRGPDGEFERVEAKTVVWAAGVQASPLGRLLAEAAGAEVDRAGRVLVLPDLTLPGHPEIFVIGDMAALDRLPGLAQVAMQEGTHAAKTIAARVAGRSEPGPFRYRDKGTMAAVGPRRAVVDAYGIKVGGFLGSLMWSFVHVLYLIGWGNRLVTLIRWLFALTFRSRSQRLIEVGQAARRAER